MKPTYSHLALHIYCNYHSDMPCEYDPPVSSTVYAEIRIASKQSSESQAASTSDINGVVDNENNTNDDSDNNGNGNAGSDNNGNYDVTAEGAVLMSEIVQGGFMSGTIG